MSHIFISYSHKDKAYVHRLQHALLEQGFEAWIDDRVDYGDRWPREIEQRLRECSAFILVMSPDANESHWVQNELLTAIKLKKTILPLLLAGEVWWQVQNTQSVDVTDGRLPPAGFYAHLTSAVARHESSAEHAREAAEKPKNEGVNIHVEGNVGGNIIVGDGNVAKSGSASPAKTPVEHGDAGRGSGRVPERVDPRLTSIDPAVKRRSPDSRSQLTNFVPAKVSGKLTIFMLAVAIISMCTAIFLSILSFQPALMNWFGQPAIVRPSPTATLSQAVTDTPIVPTLTPAPPWTPTLIVPTLTPTLEISPTPYPIEITQKGAKMLIIPAGTFTMGSDNGQPDEKPPHQVSLAAFYIDKYEVTNALYKACVDVGGCRAPFARKSFTRPAYYGNAQFDNYPVIFVDWNQAKTYCGWRGKETGNKTRLPSEAEWEYAARGSDGRTYPWGEGIDASRANYLSNKGDTTAVGSYESVKSPFGVYDMAGNVWEWVNDWYSENYYASSPSFNPLGPSTGQTRVLRGGAWYSSVGLNVRSAVRDGFAPIILTNLLGFRCALSP